MANSTLSASVIAAEAVTILDNQLVMAKQVFRGYEEEFNKNPNGYTVGDTITIRRPTDFTVRDGAVMASQDVTEPSLTLQVSKFKGVDFRFTSQQLTLNIKELSDRVIKPAMVQLANQIDSDLMALYKTVPSWVGTPGQTINSFADFALGPQRMDEYANPPDGRSAVLSPADHWGMLGSQTALYLQDVAKGAYRNATLGNIGGLDEYMSQNVPVFTTGSRTGAGTTLVNGSYTAANATSPTAANLTTNTQTIGIDTMEGATDTVKTGDIFTIAGVYAVNPVTKAPLSFLKQFVVTSDFTGSSNGGNLTFAPMLVWSGAFQNVSVQGVTDINNQAVKFLGTASTNYPQNMVFHENAFALVSVPLVIPPGAVDVSRQSYKGTNVRVIPVYDGINDVSAWRLDVLYGVKDIDPRLAHRISGT